MMERLFTCISCQRDVVDYPNRNGRDRAIEPLCKYCEGSYGERLPQSGAFMDRRIAGQISALANVLHTRAMSIEWSGRYGKA